MSTGKNQPELDPVDRQHLSNLKDYLRTHPDIIMVPAGCHSREHPLMSGSEDALAALEKLEKISKID